jgi:hypothetical protein
MASAAARPGTPAATASALPVATTTGRMTQPFVQSWESRTALNDDQHELVAAIGKLLLLAPPPAHVCVDPTTYHTNLNQAVHTVVEATRLTNVVQRLVVACRLISLDMQLLDVDDASGSSAMSSGSAPAQIGDASSATDQSEELDIENMQQFYMWFQSLEAEVEQLTHDPYTYG